MKLDRAKIAIALMAFLLGFSTFALLNTRHVGKEMTALVSGMRDTPPTTKDITRLEREWSRYEPVLDLYSRHDEVERISQAIEKLRPLYDTGQLDDFEVSLDEVTHALEHLVHTEMPTISNIL